MVSEISTHLRTYTAMAKALAAEIMIILGAIPGVAVLQYIARLPIVTFSTGLVIGIIASFALCIWGVLLDMARPMLDWTDQQKALKSNLNTIIGILAGMTILFLSGFLVYTLLRKGYSGLVVQATLGVLVLVIFTSGLRTLRVIGDKLWSSIEP